MEPTICPGLIFFNTNSTMMFVCNQNDLGWDHSEILNMGRYYIVGDLFSI